MPSIQELQNVNMDSFSSAGPVPPPDFPPETWLLPSRDPKLRFSAPFLPGTFPSSDTLTGYHIGGIIPQYRIPVPSQASAQGAGVTTATTTVTSTSTITNNPAKAQSSSATTSTISPGGQFTGVLTMAKAFVVLTVT